MVLGAIVWSDSWTIDGVKPVCDPDGLVKSSWVAKSHLELCKRRRLKAIDIDQYLAIGSEGKTSELGEMVVDCGQVVCVEQEKGAGFK